jgi:hypothetical protein
VAPRRVEPWRYRHGELGLMVVVEGFEVVLTVRAGVARGVARLSARGGEALRGRLGTVDRGPLVGQRQGRRCPGWVSGFFLGVGVMNGTEGRFMVVTARSGPMGSSGTARASEEKR